MVPGDGSINFHLWLHAYILIFHVFIDVGMPNKYYRFSKTKTLTWLHEKIDAIIASFDKIELFQTRIQQESYMSASEKIGIKNNK